MKTKEHTILEFCMIQLELLKERELDLRKQLLDCAIQREFLTKTIESLKEE